ncbi:MAG: 3-deoxy-7-phosphoheptulonate synthase [Deltaproteobacteria bacterium]|nr:3-deoxy-7-phosphoheptulonate synthase [Deltaproteobacteria bacterium]
MESNLGNIRKRLDEIDKRILDALSDRQEAIRNVARLKADGDTRLRDILREEDLLTRLVELGLERGLDSYYVTRLFREILEHSVRYQQEFLADRQNPERRDRDSVTVAFQGAEGAYSHIAAMKHFGPRETQVLYRGCDTFQSMLETVSSGFADYGMLPIENTTAGSINEAYDLLAKTNLAIVGEEVLLIEHCLIALESAEIGNIRHIYSHPQALAQCSNFLSSLPDCVVEAFQDTAMAVKQIRTEQDRSQAAIASEEAAKRYGLTVIKREIANQKDNFTRFVVVAQQGVQYDERMSCKTSLLFATRHEEGALLKCLNVLAGYGLNLTKLESRPRPNVPWEYLFYLDFEGNTANPEVKTAVTELSANTSFLKVLGSYPARTTKDTRPAQPHRTIGSRGTSTRRSEGPDGQKQDLFGQIAEDSAYKLASRSQRRNDTTIAVGNVVIGSGRPVVIAGPAMLEAEDQIIASARAVKNLGADILSAGCFSAYTGAGAFQALGLEGLKLLAQAGRSMGLPVTTEVFEPKDIQIVSRYADVVQIGGRNMQNFALLKEAGQIDRPIILRRSAMASVEEWLAAAEIILETGNQQVVLCEQGVRTFERAARNTLDLSALPGIRSLTHLPIVVDPSFACSTWRWVAPLAEAALVSGAQGIMVELHPNPQKALAHGERALSIASFEILMHQLAGRLG